MTKVGGKMAKICPKCGDTLNNDDYCNNCDLSVDIYEKVKNLSKLLYNQGLQKARIRDLSGAISLLQRSVKFDKNNIEARNLLGLVYFEIGETVSALKQWVISNNLKPEENSASEYLEQVQNNQEHLDRLNNAIKNYNQALKHIKQKSNDLAIIQLKKAIGLNTKFVKAYCLLALCYIQEKDNNKAKKTLLKVLSIDSSNYTARKYFDELKDIEENNNVQGDLPEAIFNPIKTNKTKNIMQVTSFKSQIIIVFFGVVLGLAIGIFLIRPSMLNSKNDKIDILNEKLNEINAENATLKEELDSVKQENDDTKSELDETGKQLEYTNALSNILKSIAYYEEGKLIEAANTLFLVRNDNIDDPVVKNMFSKQKSLIYPEVAGKLYDEGYRLYSTGKYEEAISRMEESLKYTKEEYFSDEALYFIARSYQRKGETEKAIEYFEKLENDYPNATKLSDAKYYLNILKQEINQEENQ